MTEAADCYDLVFVGNAGRNLLHRFDGTTEPMPGGPLFHSALATTWSDRRVAVVTRMAERDADLLEPLQKAHIDVFVSPTAETTRGHIYYVSENVDDRRYSLERTAGPFSSADLPPINAGLLDLVGIDRIEFPLQFMLDLRERGFAFAVDMQAFVCTPDPLTGEITCQDYPHKQQVAAIAQKVKLDAVEAQVLTGMSDLEQAAVQFEKWGALEIMVTQAEGALVRHEGKTYFERFSNRSAVGRTGRGDAVFASYLLRRMDWGVADSLEFAVALASVKMETAGPFSVTLEQVLERMRSDRR